MAKQTSKPATRSHDRVWFELPKPDDKTHALQICEKANRMMKKLGDSGGREFFWSDHERAYCWGGPMGYESLPDRGYWFNLDYLAK